MKFLSVATAFLVTFTSFVAASSGKEAPDKLQIGECRSLIRYSTTSRHG